MTDDRTLSVLTYNVWGLATDPVYPTAPYILTISKDIDARMAKICTNLRSGPWDVVLLQEVWRKQDRDLLSACGYDHTVDLDEVRTLGAPDSGLMILSKHPITYSLRHKFGTCGARSAWKYLRHVYDGEALCRKSALYAVIDHPTLGLITVANLHAVSRYSHHAYESERASQIASAAEMGLRLASELSEGRLIFGGDFNTSRTVMEPVEDQVGRHSVVETIASELLTKHLPHFVSLEAGDRCTSCPDNLWNQTLDKEIFLLLKHEVFKKGGGGKIDEIFASPHFHVKPQPTGVVLRPIGDATSIIRDRQGTPTRYALSDHYGFESTFLLR